jgi:hypothetical protein
MKISKKRLSKALLIFCFSLFISILFKFFFLSVDYVNSKSFPCDSYGLISCEFFPTLIDRLFRSINFDGPFGIQIITLLLISIFFSRKENFNYFPLFYVFAFFSLIEVYIYQSLALAFFLTGYKYFPIFSHLYSGIILIMKSWVRFFFVILFFIFFSRQIETLLSIITDVFNLGILVSFITDYSDMYSVNSCQFQPGQIAKILIITPYAGIADTLFLLTNGIASACSNEIFSRFFSIIFFLLLATKVRPKTKLTYSLIFFLGIALSFIEIYRDITI